MRKATVLRDYSRQVVVSRNADEIVRITSQALAALFRVPAVVILIAAGNVVSVEQSGGADPNEAELEAAQSSLTTGTVLRGGVYPYASSRFDFWPVQTAQGQSAVIGLAFDPDERPSSPDAQVGIVAAILALVLDRQHGR